MYLIFILFISILFLFYLCLLYTVTATRSNQERPVVLMIAKYYKNTN